MIFIRYKPDHFSRKHSHEKTTFVLKMITVLLINYLSFLSSPFALSPEQKQEIRYTKAMVAFNKVQEDKGLKLLRENLNGPFHYKTELFLARYFFKRRKFTKSFRLYQHMLKKTYDEEVINYSFDTKNRKQFISFINGSKKPTPLALQLSFEAAQKFFDAYNLNVFPEEFSPNLLNLSEKYFTICAEQGLYVSPSKYYLSKIYFEREEDQKAIALLKEAKEDYPLSPEKNLELGLRQEDIELLLGESLARAGFVDSGTLILRSLYSREDTASNTRSYARSFLDEIKNSYFDATLTYHLKSKSNINQLDAEDYNNFENLTNRGELGEKDGTVHHRRFNFFTGQEISSKYQASANFTYINESPTQESLSQAGFDQVTLEIDLKRYRQKTSFFGLGYRFNNLSGRDLNTLRNVQAVNSQTFSPYYSWVTQHSKWKISLPIESRTYKDERSASSLAFHVDYKPILKDSWWAPSYFAALGRRSEGDIFPSSLFYQFGLSNSYEFSSRFYWLLMSDYYSNANSDFLLNYNEITVTNAFSYFLKSYPNISFDLEASWRSRSQEGLGGITTLDLATGLTYNF